MKPAPKCGWDITSAVPVHRQHAARRPPDRSGAGRAKGATTITLTKNEIIAALNKLLRPVLAGHRPGQRGRQHRRAVLPGPVSQAPDWAEVSKNPELAELAGPCHASGRWGMSLATAQKETPARGGRRAGDAISGGVRRSFFKQVWQLSSTAANPVREAEWLA